MGSADARGCGEGDGHGEDVGRELTSPETMAWRRLGSGFTDVEAPGASRLAVDVQGVREGTTRLVVALVGA